MVSGGQSFLAPVQNLLLIITFKSSLNLNLTWRWSGNYSSGYLKQALISSELKFI